MRHFLVSSFALLLALAAATSLRAADPQLVQQLKQLGQAVDNMAANISKATSDADAAMLAQVTQQTFASQLSANPKPEVSVTGGAGRCEVLITTPLWKLWSRAENGAVVDHGATIN
jgi:hypothetical protein